MHTHTHLKLKSMTQLRHQRTSKLRTIIRCTASCQSPLLHTCPPSSGLMNHDNCLDIIIGYIWATSHLFKKDRSLQCPSNAIWPFKIYLSQNNPSKRNPKLEMKTSFEVLKIICLPQEPTSIRHFNHQKWNQMVDFLFFTLYYWKQVSYNSCTRFIWVLYFISIYLE